MFFSPTVETIGIGGTRKGFVNEHQYHMALVMKLVWGRLNPSIVTSWRNVLSLGPASCNLHNSFLQLYKHLFLNPRGDGLRKTDGFHGVALRKPRDSCLKEFWFLVTYSTVQLCLHLSDILSSSWLPSSVINFFKKKRSAKSVRIPWD